MPRRKPKATLPEGERLTLHQVADALSGPWAAEPARVAALLTRAIEAGRIRSVRDQGALCIPRAEALRLIGERPGEGPRR